MGWIRKAPTAVVIAVVIVGGIGTLGLLGGFVALELAGADTAGYLSFVSFLLASITTLLAGTSAVASVSAARSASNAEDQTNGQLTARDQEIADLTRQLDAYRDAAVRRAGGR